MNGIILLDKSPGITSAQAVARVKQSLPRSTKVGHAGTLDPFASGLLILLVGSATRYCEAVMSWTKTYEATIKLGAASATDDIDSSEVVTYTDVIVPSAADIESALASFVGIISQRPPSYSAIKIGGKRACDRVRAGEKVELAARPVRIDAIEFFDYMWPLVHVRITCSRGTYIRAIARDLGALLHVGGMLTALRRTRLGDLLVEDACTLQQLKPSNVHEFIRPIS